MASAMSKPIILAIIFVIYSVVGGFLYGTTNYMFYGDIYRSILVGLYSTFLFGIIIFYFTLTVIYYMFVKKP